MAESAKDQAARLGVTWPGATPPPPRPSRRTGRSAAIERQTVPLRQQAKLDAIRDDVDRAARPLAMLARMWLIDPAGVERVYPRRRHV